VSTFLGILGVLLVLAAGIGSQALAEVLRRRR